MQVFGCNACNWIVLPYVMFIVKQNNHLMLINGQASYVEIWLYIESMCFMLWIASLSAFMFSAYWLKFMPSNKHVEDLLDDDNVWNDKNTSDTLQFLRKDAYDWSF